ncbi:MAG TPA: alpha/beta fold hydrolase [Verrucomicrobiae bacterium]|jgi:phospholipase/carboxylesterase|nr:alpha/beta fold hydrolase [Verrucomicrobiae bacterium]
MMAALMSITGPTYGPAASGAPRQLVVLLHGYGSDGHDLLGLAPHWAQMLPRAEFISPNAPFPCELAPYGRQWFGFEGRDAQMILGEVQTAAAILNGFIDEQLAKRSLDESALALVGFSQGTMMSLHVALRRQRPAAAVVGYSGRLIAPDLLPQEIKSRPRILLVHGDADPVVPFQSLREAVNVLELVGVEVTAERRPRLAHAIDEEGLELGGHFLVGAFASGA